MVLLARNPALADHLLSLATGLPLAPLELPDQEPMRRTYLSAGVGNRAVIALNGPWHRRARRIMDHPWKSR